MPIIWGLGYLVISPKLTMSKTMVVAKTTVTLLTVAADSLIPRQAKYPLNKD